VRARAHGKRAAASNALARVERPTKRGLADRDVVIALEPRPAAGAVTATTS
jgi:hypothetical protein